MILVYLSLLIISLWSLEKLRRERYTFADYDKFTWCVCPRNKDIV